MPLSNYTDLKASIAGFLNRLDLTAVIPDFIALCEAKVNRELRTRDMLTRVTTEVEDQFTQLPSDFREAENIKFTVSGADVPIELLSPAGMVNKRAELGSATGRPSYYAFVGDALEVAKTPDGVYVLEMGYYRSVPALSANATNWLLTKHPDLYLYGSLMQSAPYLKDDERIPVWRDAYSGIIEAIRLEESRSTYSGSTPLVRSRSIG